MGSWIHVEAPTEDDIVNLVEIYGLDESLIRDATDEYEVPRMEVENGVNFTIIVSFGLVVMFLKNDWL